GMKNLFLNDIKDFKSPEAKTFYKDALALGYSEEAVLYNLRESSKDASRGAMQWDQSAFAGFSTVAPWSGVNVEAGYNVAAEEADPNSILHFYRKVLDLKKTDLFVEGDYHLWDTHDDFYVYERVMDKQVGLVICNVTDQPKEFVLHQLEPHGYRQILLQNEGNRLEGETLHLGPYGVAVFQTVYNS
ncbi:MAG TPA: alpha-glucosidase, partial [Trichococcus flocculiformis]|nr:alpha-glucosidase [Trichococcus flocculiformis]